MHSQKRILTAAVAAALFAIGASAQADEYTTLDTVKVTASRVEQELMEVPMSLSVVTEDEVKHTPAKTVADLLQDVPGVQITNAGSQGLKRIKIRGEDTFRTLVMVNGQKISEQKSMDGTAILIDPANIERIEVIKGPASVLYGSDAIGGAINIITKKGGEKAFEADASLGYDGAGHGWSESLSIGGSANRFHYRLSGNYESQDDLDTPEGRLPHTAFRTKSGSAFLSYDVTDNVEAGIQADIFDSHLRAGAVTYDPADFYVDIPEWKREKVGVFVDAKNLGDTLSRVRWDAYWQKTRKVMNNHVYAEDNKPGEVTVNGMQFHYNSASTVMDSEADNRLTTIGTSIQTDWKFSDSHYLVAGYEFSRDSLDADTYSKIVVHTNMASGNQMRVTPITNKTNEGTQTTHAVFASMESMLPLDFVANYGVRWTYVSSEMERAEVSGTTTGELKPVGTPMFNHMFDLPADQSGAGNTGKNHNARAVFNAGLTYNGFANTALRATWAQGFRVPLLQEKYLTNSMGGGTMIGNPNLKPETSNNFEIGARYNKGTLNVDATVFYSMADDYISTEIVDQKTSTSRYVNADKAKTHGVELSTSYTIAEHYTPYVSVTWMRRQLETDNYSTWDSGTPEFFSRYGLRTNHSVYGGTFVTDVYGRSQTATKTYSFSSGETTRIAGFTTFNIALGYRFGKDENYSVNAEFLNLFDQTYQLNTSSYEAGRCFAVKLTAHY